MTDRRLVDAHMRSSADRQARTGAYVARVGQAFGWTSEEYVEEAVGAVLDAQAEQAAATWSYLEEAGEMFDGRLLGVDPPVDVMIGRNTHAGTPLETVYRRPGRLLAELEADGVPDAAARVAAEAEALASTDVAVAGRKAEQVYGAVDRRIIGWRRVPNIGACKFCLSIASRRYGKQELAPAHSSCKCGTAPEFAPVDGDPVDRDALDKIAGNGVSDQARQRSADAKAANRALDAGVDLPDVDTPPAIRGLPDGARFADDDPYVVDLAARNGVTPDEVYAARGRVADVRQMIRDEAARVQLEAFEQLDDWNARSIARPPRALKDRGGEWDFLRNLDERERGRLSRQFYDDNGVGPDVIANQMRNAVANPVGDITDGDAIELWLDTTRRYEAAGAMRRGKLPSTRAYSDGIDVDDLLPDISGDGYSPRVILGNNDLEAAAHIAGVEKDLAVREALDYLGDAATNPQHGPSPYRMSYQAWEEEVRTLELGLREYPGEMPRNAKARLRELVPEYLDDGQDYEDLYALIVDTAHRAAEEVPDYARIVWQ